jgi:hypothetical protein
MSRVATSTQTGGRWPVGPSLKHSAKIALPTLFITLGKTIAECIWGFTKCQYLDLDKFVKKKTIF